MSTRVHSVTLEFDGGVMWYNGDTITDIHGIHVTTLTFAATLRGDMDDEDEGEITLGIDTSRWAALTDAQRVEVVDAAVAATLGWNADEVGMMAMDWVWNNDTGDVGAAGTVSVIYSGGLQEMVTRAAARWLTNATAWKTRDAEVESDEN